MKYNTENTQNCSLITIFSNSLMSAFSKLINNFCSIVLLIFIVIITTSETSDWSKRVPHHQRSARVHSCGVRGQKSPQIASENGNKSELSLFPRSIWTKESRAAPDSREVMISTQIDVLTNSATHSKIYLSNLQKVFVSKLPNVFV